MQLQKYTTRPSGYHMVSSGHYNVNYLNKIDCYTSKCFTCHERTVSVYDSVRIRLV